MARKVEITLIDDIDGSTASTTLEFSVAGQAYEIDLSDENVAKFEAAIEEFVENARKVSNGRRGTRASSAKPTSDVSATAVRKWAAANNVEVSARGRIPRDVMAAYLAAN